MPTSGWRHAYLGGLLLTAPICYSTEPFLSNAALGVVTLLRLCGTGDGKACARAPAPADLALLGGTCVVYALTGTTKFTYLVQGATLIAVIAGVLVLRRRFRLAALVPVTFLVAFAGVWIAVGQSLTDVPSFLLASWQVAQGYVGAQASRGADVDLWLAGICLAANVLLAATIIRSTRRLPAAGAVALCLMTLFFAWKAGFVRHDDGHAILFAAVAALVPFMLVAAGGAPPRRPATALAAAAAVAGLAMNAFTRERIGIGYASLPGVVRHNGALLSPGAFRAYVAERLAPERVACPLPAVRHHVGDVPTDLMGYQQGLLFASGIRVRHRPVFQSYSVHTQELQRMNGAFYAGADAPRFVVALVQAIDGHFPLAEDSAAWKVLLDGYFPVLADDGWLLLERRPRQTAAREPTAMLAATAEIGQWVTLPASSDWHELALDVRYTARGRLAALALRPADVFLDVQVDGEEQRFRIAPRMVAEPFLLDPLVQNERDLLGAYVGKPSRRVTAFRLATASAADARHYAASYGLRVLRRPPPAAPDDGALREASEILARLAFPTFALAPHRVEPEGAKRVVGAGGDAWILAHAPCSMHFAWPGGRGAVAAEFRIDPGAYADGRQGDGAVFRVEVGATLPRRVVFERALDPWRRPGDREPQRLLVEVDLPPGGAVVLTTAPGPQRDASHDWTCWRGVRLIPAVDGALASQARVARERAAR
jgi:hypothetical protein